MNRSRSRSLIAVLAVGSRWHPWRTQRCGRIASRLTVGGVGGAIVLLLAACGSGSSDTTAETSIAAKTSLAAETTVAVETTVAGGTDSTAAAETTGVPVSTAAGSTAPETTVPSAATITPTVPSVTTAPPTTTTPTLTTASSSTMLGSPSTVVLSQRCQAKELAASLGRADVGAGNLYQPLVVRNIGQRTCSLDGYPGVSILDSAGVQIGQPAERAQGVRTTIPLAPGTAASALLHTTNGPIGDPCLAPSASMKLYPPNETESLTFPVVYTTCGGFSVRPFVAGELGQ